MKKQTKDLLAGIVIISGILLFQYDEWLISSGGKTIIDSSEFLWRIVLGSLTAFVINIIYRVDTPE